MAFPAMELLRSKAAVYKKWKLGQRDLTEQELIDLMGRYPDLIQRPMVAQGHLSFWPGLLTGSGKSCSLIYNGGLIILYRQKFANGPE